MLTVHQIPQSRKSRPGPTCPIHVPPLVKRTVPQSGSAASGSSVALLSIGGIALIPVILSADRAACSMATSRENAKLRMRAYEKQHWQTTGALPEFMQSLTTLSDNSETNPRALRDPCKFARVWTKQAQMSAHCAKLLRTGKTESGNEKKLT